MVDVAGAVEAVALIAATGGASGLGEDAVRGVVARIRERVRGVFGGDVRSVDALDRAVADPGDAWRVRELAAALAWYTARDEEFAAEVVGWAQQYGPAAGMVQNIHAGRDAYTAGRDMTVQQRPETDPASE